MTDHPLVGAEKRVCEDEGCARQIVFVMLPSGAAVPVDPEPLEEGTVRVTEVNFGKARGAVLGKAAKQAFDGPLYRPHFANCPAAARFRKPRA